MVASGDDQPRSQSNVKILAELNTFIGTSQAVPSYLDRAQNDDEHTRADIRWY